MTPLPPRSPAPPVPGLTFGQAPLALFFFKVTCPVCQLAAPPVETFERAYPERIAGIGQDPPGRLADFSKEHGLTFRVIPDDPPYRVSRDYGVRVVPTVFLVDAEGAIDDVVESWDRNGLNRVSARLAGLEGAEYVPISVEGDGLPPFRPG